MHLHINFEFLYHKIYSTKLLYLTLTFNVIPGNRGFIFLFCIMVLRWILQPLWHVKQLEAGCLQEYCHSIKQCHRYEAISKIKQQNAKRKDAECDRKDFSPYFYKFVFPRYYQNAWTIWAVRCCRCFDQGRATWCLTIMFQEPSCILHDRMWNLPKKEDIIYL